MKISTDLLRIDDVVRVHRGASTPFDSLILEGTSSFDASSLIGKSRLVKKAISSDTVNKAAPVRMKVTTISGTPMLDQIINAVEKGRLAGRPLRG